jgi:hypothetical protein
MSYLIDKIVPKHQVHIINGPSGVGKTRWIVWLHSDWKEGKPVLGYESFPVPALYIAKDRNQDSLDLTFKSINAEHTIEHKSLLYDKKTKIENLAESFPDYKLFYLDPIVKFMVPCRINDYGAVSDFLSECSEYCQRDKITIYGTCHAPKKKEGQNYENPREWTLGSGAWGGYSETMFSLNGDDLQTPNSTRYFYVLPRNAREDKYYFRLEDGWVTLVDDPKQLELYQQFIELIPENQTNSRADLVKIVARLGGSVSNFDRDYLYKADKDG